MPGTTREARSTITASVIDEVMQSLLPKVSAAHLTTSAAGAPLRASAASAANCSIVRASLSAVMQHLWDHSRPKSNTVHANYGGHANLYGSPLNLLPVGFVTVSDLAHREPQGDTRYSGPTHITRRAIAS